ncbi:MAG: glycosyltransferase N-terminal domain-containing protein, partial [Candidatus Glassbacteria bacterium]
MGFWQTAYNGLGLPLARAGFRLAAPFRTKIARGLAGRAKSFEKIESFLESDGRKERPHGVLYHCTSVGEYLQALPIMEELKKQDPGLPLYLSFFSPSVEKRAFSCSLCDLAFYLPEDSRANMDRLFERLRPELLVISKFDVWPNLVHSAHRQGVSSAITAATLSPDSGRLRGLSASFHRSFYKYLGLVCAISREDADNFIRLGVSPQNCVVTGDTRFDQTWRRAAAVAEDDPLVTPFRGWQDCRLLACGSIWPQDEQRVLPALAALCDQYDRLRLVLVPHEPSASHIERLTSYCRSRGLDYRLYSEFNQANQKGRPPALVKLETRVVIVDTLGALAAVYRAAHVVYVGGSFGKGVHNTMEPACFGLPVVFGPRHLNSYEARLMV